MVQFLVKRFIGLIFVVIGVTFITFIMGYFAPGDPIREMLGNHVIPQVYNQLKHQYGLDLPWYQQYWNFLTHLARFDFGLSYHQQNYPVWNILSDGVPVSAELGFWALILQILVGVPLGIISALKANTWVDTVNMGTMLILYALPAFVLAIFVQLFIVWIDQQTGATWPVANWGNPWQYSLSDIPLKHAGGAASGLCANRPGKRPARARCYLSPRFPQCDDSADHGLWFLARPACHRSVLYRADIQHSGHRRDNDYLGQ